MTRMLFVPGRYSERIANPDKSIGWELAPASSRRGAVASRVFDPDRHDIVAFSAGWPGFENWPKEHIPPPGRREGNGLAQPLKRRLAAEGWTEAQINERVHVYEAGSSSIGDVLAAAAAFEECDEVDVVAGALHAARFRRIIPKVTKHGIEIGRVSMHDIYARDRTKFHGRDFALVAATKELAAVALTHRIMDPVEPGNLAMLAAADEQFSQIAAQGLGDVGRAIIFGPPEQVQVAA